ncbi:MAG: hypothetical protein GY951_05040 [Psychromonas sp.]|nr:hypothetical protein [Alteromonadales bacterium]MCP5077406.1 hypothetical protein [Psychromonas sp.]
MKLSYILFFIMLLVTAISFILSLTLQDQFQLLEANASLVLSMGLLFATGLYAFDDHCKNAQGKLGVIGQLTRTILNRL